MSKDYGRAGLHPRQNKFYGGQVRPYRSENRISSQKCSKLDAYRIYLFRYN